MISFVVRDKKLAEVRKPPPKLRPGWALVRVRMPGFAIPTWRSCAATMGFAARPGHEFVGELAEVAEFREDEDAVGRQAGSQVEINVSCMAYGFRPVCEFCQRGMKTHCARRTVLGIVAHDGAFAEYLALATGKSASCAVERERREGCLY